jgi:hypothetical protein
VANRLGNWFQPETLGSIIGIPSDGFDQRQLFLPVLIGMAWCPLGIA